jgi:serine/threonine-protein kinase
MVTTDLGACEWFVWDLRRSNLLDRGQLDQVVGEFLEKNPRAEPPALAEFLVNQNIITRFQADRLLQGKTQGFVLGPFTLMDILGAGSMGTVYKALSKNDQQWYAVKVLPRRSMWNVRIARRKVRVFEQCKHPAVVPFVDVGTSGGMHYLAWPLVEGETLDKVVSRQGKLHSGLAAFYASQTAEGLDICHQQGLFHGFLKPSNLMIGANQQVRILDFGIGSLLAETEGESLVDTMSTASSLASGLDCASPESIMDPTNLTPLGDQYGLGCVLYYCLAGQFPFPDGTAAEKMMAHQFKQPKPIRELVPGLPEGLVSVIERLMQKAPEARYGSSSEVIDALRPFVKASLTSSLSTAPAVAPPSSNPPQKTRPQAPIMDDTPRPALRASDSQPPAARSAPPPARSTASAPVLPSRQSLSRAGGEPASARKAEVKPASVPVVPAPVPRPTLLPKTDASEPVRPRLVAGEPPNPVLQPWPQVSWEERLGPVGIVVSALVVCALAWLVTWKLF